MMDLSRLERRLRGAVERFDLVEARMGATADGGEITRLAREYAELKPVAEAVRALDAARWDVENLEAMRADAEMRALAEEEIGPARARLEAASECARRMLIPKDKDASGAHITKVKLPPT